MTKEEVDMLSQTITRRLMYEKFFFLSNLIAKEKWEYLDLENGYLATDAFYSANVPFVRVRVRYASAGPKFMPEGKNDYLIGFDNVSELLQYLADTAEMRTFDYRLRPQCFMAGGFLTSETLLSLKELFNLFDAVNSKVNSDEILYIDDFIDVVYRLFHLLNFDTQSRFFSVQLTASVVAKLNSGRYTDDDLDTFVDLWDNQVMNAVEDLKEFIEKYKREVSRPV